MCGTMGIWTEVFVLAADSEAIWMPDGGYLHPERDVVSAEGKMATAYRDVEWFLHKQGRPISDLLVLHQMSTHEDDDHQKDVSTYVAILLVDEYVLDRYPGAKPLDRDFFEVMGAPDPHHPVGAPGIVREVDVLAHALKHLRDLIGPEGDVNIQAVLSDWWPVHLAALAPVFKEMYRQVHEAAVVM